MLDVVLAALSGCVAVLAMASLYHRYKSMSRLADQKAERALLRFREKMIAQYKSFHAKEGQNGLDEFERFVERHSPDHEQNRDGSVEPRRRIAA